MSLMPQFTLLTLFPSRQILEISLFAYFSEHAFSFSLSRIFVFLYAVPTTS